MDTSRIQILTVLVAVALLVGVIELVRRRRLLERYSLVWLVSALVLLALASWRGALDRIAQEIGVAYPPNALFIVAFGFVLWMLLHFSVAVSRLTDQSKILAQRLALLEERMRRAETEAERDEDDDERQVELAEVGPARPERTFRRAGKR
ncbi:MAG: DUF2304 domain-containing protein [Solirubrobacteraceae bacterium]